MDHDNSCTPWMLGETIEITEIGPSKKFIQIEIWKGPNGALEYRNNGILFTTKTLLKDKITKWEKDCALRSMAKYLMQAIQKEVDDMRLKISDEQQLIFDSIRKYKMKQVEKEMKDLKETYLADYREKTIEEKKKKYHYEKLTPRS